MFRLIKKYLIILNFILASCIPINHSINVPNTKNTELQSTFEMYVNSVSFNIPHNKYYLDIINYNHPNERKNNKKINLNPERYPYYPELMRNVEEVLYNAGYKNGNKNKITKETLIPISLSFIYGVFSNTQTLITTLEARNFNLNHTTNYNQLTYQQLFDNFKHLTHYPLWQTTLTVKEACPINNNFTFIFMIKCATPYLNKNFEGVVKCERR